MEAKTKKFKDIAKMFRYRGIVYTKMEKEHTCSDGTKINAVIVSTGECVYIEPDAEVIEW